MNINVTLIVQMLVFAIFIWVVMNFIWPIILGAMNEREKKIASGLAAAEQGQKDLSEAKSRADEVIKEARARAMAIESQAQTRANQIVEEARQAASLEGEKELAKAKSQIELESNRARDQLRGQVVSLAVAGAKRVLETRSRRQDARRAARSARGQVVSSDGRGTWLNASPPHDLTRRPSSRWRARATRSAPTSTGLQRAATVVADPAVRGLLTSPHVTPPQLAELVNEIAGLDEDGRNFVSLLATNRRLGFLPEIAALFEQMKSDVENAVDVEVVAATQLTPDQESRYAAALQKKLGRQVRLHTRIDDSLLGGAVLKAGDLVIDGSLRGRLERLATELTA